MYKGRSLISVFAAVFAACAFAVPAFAQVEGWGSDVEDFSTSRPAQMKADGGLDFGAALEAASAAEGRSSGASAGRSVSNASAAATAGGAATATASAGTAAAAGGAAAKTDSAAAKTEKKKEKAQKAEGSGEKLGNNMGARLGVGFDIDLSIGFGIGLSDVNRLGLGFNMGWGTVNGYGFDTYEGFGFFDWNINLSDDGALRWFVGPGVTFGRYRAQKDNWIDVLSNDTSWTVHIEKTVGSTVSVVDSVYREKTYTKKNDRKMGDAAFSIGLGARTGLEVDLSFIDPDHPLSILRSSSVSLDVRFMVYLLMERTTDEKTNIQSDLYHYPWVMPSLGITYNYVFGGGKNK